MPTCHFTCVSVLLVIFGLILQSLLLAVVHVGSCGATRDDLGRNSFPKYSPGMHRGCNLFTYPPYASASSEACVGSVNVLLLQRAVIPPIPAVFVVFVAGWSCFVTCFLTSVIAPPRVILNNESLTLFEVRTHVLCDSVPCCSPSPCHML